MKKICIVFLFACLCSMACQPGIKPVTGVRALPPVQVDESTFVFNNPPDQVHALNDTTLLLHFRYEVVWLHARTGKIIRVFDVRHVNTDSLNLAWYKTHDPKHDYFSIRHDTTVGVSLDPQVLSMNCSDGYTDLVIYAPIAHISFMHEISPEQRNSRQELDMMQPDSKVNIIENKPWLLRLSDEGNVKSAAMIVGPSEPAIQPLFIATSEFGFCISGNRLYSSGVKKGGLPKDFEQVFTSRDSAILLGSSRFSNGLIVPEKIQLATSDVPGYRYPFSKLFQIKHFRTWHDTLFVNAEYGLYTLPDAKPYHYQFRDTTGEIRNQAFAKINNAIAYLAERKNPADTSTWQQVLRITNQHTNKLLFFALSGKSVDVAAYTNTFYTITADDEHYYINRYETY